MHGTVHVVIVRSWVFQAVMVVVEQLLVIVLVVVIVVVMVLMVWALALATRAVVENWTTFHTRLLMVDSQPARVAAVLVRWSRCGTSCCVMVVVVMLDRIGCGEGLLPSVEGSHPTAEVVQG